MSVVNKENKYDVVIIGAGFAGMYSLYKAKLANMKAIVLERASDVGGTWYWNRYPGARCDVESMQYSYQFSKELQDEWEWTEKYATQPEILKYAKHVAERFDLKKNIKFNIEVKSAKYMEKDNFWEIIDSNRKTIKATFCIMATGCLSTVNKPKFKKGTGRIYEALKIKCQPVAINSGYVWPKNKPLKGNKIITISILKPIEPSLDKEEFLNILENNIYSELDKMN